MTDSVYFSGEIFYRSPTAKKCAEVLAGLERACRESRKRGAMKRIAVTMGEPGGIGPEVALKGIEKTRGLGSFVLVGDREVLAEASRGLHRSPAIREVKRPVPGEAGVVHLIHSGSARGYRKGRPTAAGGRASLRAIEKAVSLAREGAVDAVVTAPISKEAFKMAGAGWPGHTEMLADLTRTRDFRMMLVGGPLRVMLVTIHRALRQVPRLITRARVLGTLRLAHRACRMLSLEGARMAVAGLNPHAGEAGMFGDEEENAIAPAVRDAKKEGIPVTGPFPPDTLFYRAARGEFDLVVSMYHDQGLIPLKLLAFETGVNVTVGLPIVRTSPDHGTAYEIAWQGRADPSSMAEAMRLATELHLSRW
jgi:4-hydroxythreonine-4-phosphate dehydrogenase